MPKIFPQPEKGTYPTYYDKYFELINSEKNILNQMNEDADHFQQIITQFPAESFGFAYAENKWTVAQVLQHIIDTERILAFRALSIARGEKASLPGFDENEYNKNVIMDHKDFHLLAIEFFMVRQASISLFLGLSEEELKRTGLANNNQVSVIALSHMIVAHARHHFKVLKERYA